MPRPEVSIIVCVDPRRCLRLQSHGRSGEDLLQEVQRRIEEGGLAERVRATPCRCIFGCTYGPRIDVARNGSGGKSLYGTVEGRVTISRRGTVDMQEIPQDLLDLALENLGGGDASADLPGSTGPGQS